MPYDDVGSVYCLQLNLMAACNRSVTYKLPPLHSHITKIPNGVHLPKKTVTEQDVKLQPLWHEEDGRRHNAMQERPPVAGAMCGPQLSEASRRLLRNTLPVGKHERVNHSAGRGTGVLATPPGHQHLPSRPAGPPGYEQGFYVDPSIASGTSNGQSYPDHNTYSAATQTVPSYKGSQPFQGSYARGYSSNQPYNSGFRSHHSQNANLPAQPIGHYQQHQPLSPYVSPAVQEPLVYPPPYNYSQHSSLSARQGADFYAQSSMQAYQTTHGDHTKHYVPEVPVLHRPVYPHDHSHMPGAGMTHTYMDADPFVVSNNFSVLANRRAPSGRGRGANPRPRDWH